MSPKIILATINARYSHTSLALRCLKANLKEYEQNTTLLEYNLEVSADEIAEAIIAEQPDFLGLSCYIWNIDKILKVAEIVKAIRPEIKIIFGGPEVSYEYDEFLPYCDYLIVGEGENALYHIIKEKPQQKTINMPACNLAELKMPYYLYTNEDIQNRLIYVEATRGCPFSCEFCLSALSRGVREFNLDLFLENMDNLIKRGVKQFKFIDRTFNIKYNRVKAILDFFKSQWTEGMLLHFEIFPDKLSNKMLEEIKNFPNKGLHLEAGVQTFYPPALRAISRTQDEEKTLKNLEFIQKHTGAVIHSDLVAGLPYTTLKTFAEDFNKITAHDPQEVQIGVLKRLRGATIDRHTLDCKMIYSKHPPYEVLQTKDITYLEMQQIKRMARYFDLFYNCAKFPNSMKLLLQSKTDRFTSFWDFSQYIWSNYNQTHKISIQRQSKILFDYLSKYVEAKTLARAMFQDYITANRSDRIEYITSLLK